MTDSLRPETLALHGGQAPDSATNARAVPIYQTTSYVFDDTQHAADLFALQVPGNIYTRIMNPTWGVLEERLAALEGGIARARDGLRAGRGHLLGPERHAGRREHHLGLPALRRHLQPVRAHAARSTASRSAGPTPTIPARSRASPTTRPGSCSRETIGNPRLNVLDVDAWAAAAHAQGLPLILDNTVPTPIGARVFEQGADIAVHSLTKFIGGHGTSIGGAIVDSGTFDWTAQRDRFPGLTHARPVLPRRRLDATRSVRPPTSAARGRSCCATPVRRSRRSTRSCSCRGSRRSRCGWSATTTTRSRSPAPRAAPRCRLGLLPGPASRARTTRSPSASCAAATARSSRSASRAAPRPGARSSRT